MDLVRPHKKYSRLVDEGFDHEHDTKDSINLTTFASRSSAELEGSNTSRVEYNSTYHLGRNARQGEGLVKRSTTTVFSGWRLGAWTAGSLAIISLMINLMAAIYLVTHRDVETSLVEVYKGDCDKAHSLDLGIHLLINLVSTLLLGGSNYCMQCLCSPSRDEVDCAHAKGVPLDIGVLSPGNLFVVGKLKRALWCILAFSSIPLHLMYNSSFYTSIGALDYDYYVVQPEFLVGDLSMSPGTKDPSIVYYGNKTRSGHFQNLTNLECIQAYAKLILTDWSTLLLVTSNSSSNYGVVASAHYSVHSIEFYGYDPYSWICKGDPNFTPRNIDFPDAPTCDEYVSKIESVAEKWVVLNETIDYCLAERAEQRCTFSGNLPIVVAVLTCNILKAIVMFYVAVGLPGSPMITIGDAIQSFLDKPDPTTKDLCWATRHHILDYVTYAYHFPHAPWPANTANAKAEPQTVSLGHRRWFNAASRTRWVSTAAFVALALAVSIGLFIAGYKHIYSADSRNTHRTIKQLGFGELQPLTFIDGWWQGYGPAGQILAAVLLANLPQIIFSFLYLNLNGLLTSMWLADEWHRFATQRKYLRVSSPKGKQRSTHFLQLPYKISLPLMIVSGFLHWTLSRSIFLVVVSQYDENGDLIDPTFVATCGYSLLPILVTIVTGLVVLFTTLGLGFRQYDGRIPLVGSCSAAISAACHRPDWDHDAALKPVQYGELVSEDSTSNFGHCCFTSVEIEFAIEGKLYAGG